VTRARNTPPSSASSRRSKFWYVLEATAGPFVRSYLSWSAEMAR
jgi:hypothetical protein